MVLSSVNIAIQAISRSEDCGRAAAMYAFMRTLGMSIGVAVGGTVFQNVMSNRLRDYGLSVEIAREAEAIVPQVAALPPTEPVRAHVLDCYVQGFHGVFWVMTGIAAFGMLAGFCIKSHSMDKTLESQFVINRSTAALSKMTRGGKVGEEASQSLMELCDNAPPHAVNAHRQSFSASKTSLSTISDIVQGYAAYPEQPPVVAFVVGPGVRRTEVDLGCRPAPWTQDFPLR